MAKPVLIKPHKIVTTLRKAGYQIRHQSANHVLLISSDGSLKITMPYHNQGLPKTVFMNIVRASGLTPAQFKDLLVEKQ